MRTLLELFQKSPFGPLVEHAKKANECVQNVRPLFEALLAEDFGRVDEIYQRISKIEHEADEIKAEIRDGLPKSVFLPVDRGDMLKHIKQQDLVADCAEDVGVLLTIRRTRIHPGLKPQLLLFIDKVIETSEQLERLAEAFQALVKASFGGPEVDKVLELIRDVDRKEWESDQLQIALAKEMFRIEKELDPVTIEMYLRVFKALGDIANHAQSAADNLRMMISRTH
jgi:predicted phosphate transport protein (TIGR00153 family)